MTSCSLGGMPRNWTDTVDAHRVEVRSAILNSAWELVGADGLFAVTMSRIAEASGISRATLYKYFPNVESILTAYHLQHVEAHVGHLQALADEPGQPLERLNALATAWMEICRRRFEHGSGDLSSLLHREPAVAQAEERVRELFRSVLDRARTSRDIRADIPVADLADYCIRALAAASSTASAATRATLVEMTISGLLSPRRSS